MAIVMQDDWNEYVEKNKDPYGKACVDVARKVMEILDNQERFDPHAIICQASDDIESGGITGFMAGCVASMVSECHSRGNEFRKAWNGQYDDEGRNGVINPALMTINIKEINDED